MKKKVKWWFMWIAVLCGMGFVLLNVLAYSNARAMMTYADDGERSNKPESLSFLRKVRVLFCGVNIPRPSSDISPLELDSQCKALSIEGEGNVQLVAWYCNKGAGTPLVMVFHGYSSQKADVMDEAKGFLEQGTSVLMVDFRGSGGSSESYTSLGVCEADDVASVFEYAKEHYSHSSYILYGTSMGAAALLRAIDKAGVMPDAVIIEAVFDNMLRTVQNRFDAMGVPSFPSSQLMVFWGGVRMGFNGFAHNPVDYAKSLHCPALFLHGADDPRAKLSEGRSVYDAVPGDDKVFVELRDVGHESYVSSNREAWIKAVSKFLSGLEPITDH